MVQPGAKTRRLDMKLPGGPRIEPLTLWVGSHHLWMTCSVNSLLISFALTGILFSVVLLDLTPPPPHSDHSP